MEAENKVKNKSINQIDVDKVQNRDIKYIWTTVLTEVPSFKQKTKQKWTTGQKMTIWISAFS